MKILISGASGMIGSALVASLERNGHEVHRLVRRPPIPGTNECEWDPTVGHIDSRLLNGMEMVFHLAGENVGGGRWTEARKRRIRDSRVLGTRILAETLVKVAKPPLAMIMASATGFYGSRGQEELTEEADSGSGFLSAVTRQWEQAAAAAEKGGVRVAMARFGIVLASEGGALKKMLTPFRLGVGGRLGSGNQYMSWISLPDAVAALEFLMNEETAGGPWNLTAPEPVTNREFTAILGKVLRRPTVFPMPAFAARLAFGREMAEEMLLSSCRALPKKLLAAGFRFRHTDLESALREVLGQPGQSPSSA